MGDVRKSLGCCSVSFQRYPCDVLLDIGMWPCADQSAAAVMSRVQGTDLAAMYASQTLLHKYSLSCV